MRLCVLTNLRIKCFEDDFKNSAFIKYILCFSNSPICTPFRGMLMTGQYSLYNGCYTNDRPLLPGNGKMFAEVLRDDGYKTGYIGK
jgi:arylsulfatase A-like enzyme